jgi:hypothetical protein
MKHLFLLFVVFLLTNCTIIKVYSGDNPYFLQETGVVVGAGSIGSDSIKILNNGQLLIIKGSHVYDSSGRLIK